MTTQDGEEPVDPDELARSLQQMPAWQVDEIDPPGTDSPPLEPEQVSESNTPIRARPDNDETSPPPLMRIIESMLFVGDAPLTQARARGTIRELGLEEFHAAIDELNRRYRAQGRPYLIRKRNQGYELALRRSFAALQQKMRGGTREAKLSPTVIEVLAMVAYRQPVTLQDVDSLRGADSIGPLRQLVRHGLIAVQRDAATKSTLYVTTPRFLETFQLSSLDDLPQAQELQQL